MSNMSELNQLCDRFLADRVTAKEFKETLLNIISRTQGSQALLIPLAKAIKFRADIVEASRRTK